MLKEVHKDAHTHFQGEPLGIQERIQYFENSAGMRSRKEIPVNKYSGGLSLRLNTYQQGARFSVRSTEFP